jgi:hypothetical protein
LALFAERFGYKCTGRLYNEIPYELWRDSCESYKSKSNHLAQSNNTKGKVKVCSTADWRYIEDHLHFPLLSLDNIE